jgi:hypothetical protein
MINQNLSLKSDWRLNEVQIKDSLRRISEDSAHAFVLSDERAMFLYAKDILTFPAVRASAYDLLIKHSGVEWSAAYDRLDRIVAKGEDQLKIFSRSYFDDFTANHAEWSASTSFVIFRDHPNLKYKPHSYVERVQLSGLLCYTRTCSDAALFSCHELR